MSSGHFVKRVLLVFLIGALLLAVWQIANVLLLAFGGVLLAIFIRQLARRLCAYTPLSMGPAVVTVVVLLIAALALTGWLLGPLIAVQMNQLWEQLPTGLGQFRDALRQSAWGRFLLDNAPDFSELSLGSANIFGTITGTVSLVFGTIANAIIVLMLGLYLAVEPPLYNSGLLLLVPRERRQRIAEVLDAAGHALWQWLLGQFIAMVAVGVVTTLALLLLGIPLAFALGFIAGLLNFIPFVGPFLSAAPAVLIGFSVGPWEALYVALAFLVIQQLEGNVLMPLIQQRAVSLPPAVAIISIVAFGVLFGPVGILLATPLAVVLIILVKMLYIEDVLGEHVKVQGREPDT